MPQAAATSPGRAALPPLHPALRGGKGPVLPPTSQHLSTVPTSAATPNSPLQWGPGLRVQGPDAGVQVRGRGGPVPTVWVAGPGPDSPHPFQAAWGHLYTRGNGCLSRAGTRCELGFLPPMPVFGGASFLLPSPTLGHPLVWDGRGWTGRKSSLWGLRLPREPLLLCSTEGKRTSPSLPAPKKE